MSKQPCSPSMLYGDCLNIMRDMPSDSVDLVFCSPPYEAARTYGIDFKLKGQAWVDWAVERYIECVRVSRGLVAWVVEGQTRQFRWSATPALLMADLHRAGIRLRKPPAFKKFLNGEMPPGSKLHTKNNGASMRVQCYVPPAIANPGNVIECSVGGGRMGSLLAHENEAPFPEKLAEAFILSFCPKGGTVLDCFCGSGTTLAVAMRNERESIGIDIRESQIELSRRRLAV